MKNEKPDTKRQPTQQGGHRYHTIATTTVTLELRHPLTPGPDPTAKKLLYICPDIDITPSMPMLTGTVATFTRGMPVTTKPVPALTPETPPMPIAMFEIIETPVTPALEQLQLT